MPWISILGKISIWIILLPLLIGILGLSKLNKDSVLILLIVFIGTIPQVLNPFIKDSGILKFLYNLYTPLEFLTYWTLFYRNIRPGKLRLIAVLILGLFCFISVSLMLKNNLFSSFVTVWVLVNNSFQLVLAGMCLLTFIYSDDLNFSKEMPLFWFMIGIVLYASCTILFYSLWDYLKRSNDPSITFLNVIHHIFNISLYLFFGWGLYLNIRRSQLVIA